MEEWRDARAGGRPDAPRPIDRIVLYIDDLDRCSSEQVVEVLQAVHLLLALDLFVVVVGVDPRWLLRSLRREYRSDADDGAQPTGQDRWWETTPQDYLEKIFNIPFALPRMSPRQLRRCCPEPRASTRGGDEAGSDRGARREPGADAAPRRRRVEAAGRRSRAAIPVEARVGGGRGRRPARAEPEVRPLTEPELDAAHRARPARRDARARRSGC